MNARSIPLLAFALLLPQCGTPPAGSADAEARVDPGPARIDVVVRVASARSVSRVVVELRPERQTLTLAFDGASSRWAGTLTAAARPSTVVATAYAGRTTVGSVATDLVPAGGGTTAVFLRILDASGPWPVPGSGTAITAFWVSPTATRAGSPVEGGVAARDALNVPIAYRWTADCEGAFSNPLATRTSFTPATAGACTLTAHALGTGPDAYAVRLDVPARAGTVEIDGTFVPWPTIDRVTLTGPLASCDVLRTSTDASCPADLHASSDVVVAAEVRAAAGAPVKWHADCGGESGAFAAGDAGEVRWTTPATADFVVCVVTAEVDSFGMIDRFPVAVLIVPAPAP